MLKCMYEGGIETINSRVVIDTGEPVARFFLNKYWKDDMGMKQMAELGYFIIQAIMEYDLENTVGLSSTSDINETLSMPRIHFIADNTCDYRADPFLEEWEKRTKQD